MTGVSATRRLTATIRRRQAEGLLPVIPEVKVRSPKSGDLLRGRAPAGLARTMAATRAAGISVVTEGPDFGGSLELLRDVADAVELPVLRKDFLRDVAGVVESLAAGAAAILLTVCLLDEPLLVELHAAAREVGLETLVEVHDRLELERVLELELEPDLLGLNNRDIRVRETDDGDVSLTEGLAGLAPPGRIVISESAIEGPEDARRARAAGADAILVGTSILQARDPGAAIDALVAVGWAPGR